MVSTITATSSMAHARSASMPRKSSSTPFPTSRSSSCPSTGVLVSHAPEKPESLISRYFYTPLLFASFLLSFLLIDNRNHSRTTNGRGRSEEGNDKKPWVWRAKHRKLARLEIGQALEMRHAVALVIVVGMSTGCLCLWWMTTWMYGVVGRLLGLA